MSNYKVDIFKLLKSIDLGDKTYYNSLSPDERKSIQPYVLMRYLSSTNKNTSENLIFVNEILNKDHAIYNEFQELYYNMLFSMFSYKYQQNHTWIAPPAQTKKNQLHETLKNIHRHYSDREIDVLISTNTKETIVEFLEDNGFDKKSIDTLLKNAKN